MPHKEAGRTNLHTIVNEHFERRPIYENVEFNRIIRIRFPSREFVREKRIPEAFGLTTIDEDLPLRPVVANGYRFPDRIADVNIQSLLVLTRYRLGNQSRFKLEAGTSPQGNG